VLGSPEQPGDVYAQVFDTNVCALFNTMRHEIPALLTSGAVCSAEAFPRQEYRLRLKQPPARRRYQLRVNPSAL
jgi:hypothetical protein